MVRVPIVILLLDKKLMLTKQYLKKYMNSNDKFEFMYFLDSRRNHIKTADKLVTYFECAIL